jgi:hypothetical protein
VSGLVTMDQSGTKKMIPKIKIIKKSEHVQQNVVVAPEIDYSKGKKSRDAPASMCGFFYQRMWSIKLILDTFKENKSISWSIAEEYGEDIMILIIDGRYYYQIKYSKQDSNRKIKISLGIFST